MRARVSRQPYRPRRDRREVAISVVVASAIVGFSGLLVWVFAPDQGNGGASTPVTSSATSTSSAPSTTAPATTETTTAG